MLIIGCDPGLGVKSSTGFAAFDDSNFTIRGHGNLTIPKAKKLTLAQRIGTITLQLQLATRAATLYGYQPNDFPALFAIEYFVMKGKGGESLQRLVGAFLASLPPGTLVREVQNTKVKKVVGGAGTDDKLAVARGVQSWFRARNPKSAQVIKELIEGEEFDILDAFAIAITGYLEREA